MSAQNFGMPTPFPMMNMSMPQMSQMGGASTQSNTLYVGDLPKEVIILNRSQSDVLYLQY